MTFFMLTLLAFFTHQLLELADPLYQLCRQDFCSRKEFWNQIRCTFVDHFNPLLGTSVIQEMGVDNRTGEFPDQTSGCGPGDALSFWSHHP